MTTILRGITWDHPRGLNSVLGCAAEWSDRHPDVRIQWETRSLQGFADQSLESLVTNFDLLVIDNPHIAEAHERGFLTRLDEHRPDAVTTLSKQSVGKSHASYHVGGHQYALGLDAAAQVAVYRPDLLPQPPTTWEEVFSLAERGRVLWPAKPVDAISSFITLAANMGSPVAPDDTNFVDPEVGVAVLQHLHRLADLVPGDCLAENPIETAERLSTTDSWWYSPLAFGYTNYSRQGFRQHRLAYVDMPLGAEGLTGSCLGGAGIAVSARSQHQDLAIDHAFWLASAETQSGVYYASGGQPGNSMAWEADAPNADSLDFFRNTRETLEGAWLRPQYTGWLDVQDETGLLINQALRHQISDAECLQRMSQTYASSRRRASVQ